MEKWESGTAGSGMEKSGSGTAEASATQTVRAEVYLTPVMARPVMAPAGRSWPLAGWLVACVLLTDGAELTSEASKRCALAPAWYLLRRGF